MAEGSERTNGRTDEGPTQRRRECVLRERTARKFLPRRVLLSVRWGENFPAGADFSVGRAISGVEEKEVEEPHFGAALRREQKFQ